MAAELDLDITHYELHDLVSFFRLDPNQMYYTANELIVKEKEMRELLLSSGHIAKHLKRDLIVFLEKAREILVRHKVQPPKKKTVEQSQQVPPPSYPVKEPDIWPSRESEIVPLRPPTQFSYTQNSEYFPGILNPIDTRTLKKCMTIDTRFRSNYYSTKSSDFVLSLPNRIPKVISVECTSFEIAPGTIPNISSSLGNDYLTVTVVTSEQMFSQVFILTDGYYTTLQLLDALNVLFAQQKHTPFMFIEFVFDPSDTGKVVLTTTDDSKKFVTKILEIQMDFRVDKHGSSDKKDHFAKMGRMLGFTRRTYFHNFTYIAETVPNPFLDLTYFYLAVEDYQNRSSLCFEPAFSQISMPPSILARLSFQTLQSLSYHSKVEPLSLQCIPRKYFGPVDINRLRISLLDAYGTPIVMDDCDYSFSLIFNTVYDL